jgi:predicted peptidase
MKRIYLTGLSLSKKGAWRTAQDNPEFFAALAPVSREGAGWYPCLGKFIWIFN